MTEKDILKLLIKTRQKALAGFSNFRVAAVLLTKDGKAFTGFNIESSSYSLTICAERVALFKALSEDARDFTEIHILSDDASPCPPCGACRQILIDYAPEIKIIMYSSSGEKKEASIKDLLPYAFTPDNLKKK